MGKLLELIVCQARDVSLASRTFYRAPNMKHATHKWGSTCQARDVSLANSVAHFIEHLIRICDLHRYLRSRRRRSASFFLRTITQLTLAITSLMAAAMVENWELEMMGYPEQQRVLVPSRVYLIYCRLALVSVLPYQVSTYKFDLSPTYGPCRSAIWTLSGQAGLRWQMGC